MRFLIRRCSGAVIVAIASRVDGHDCCYVVCSLPSECPLRTSWAGNIRPPFQLLLCWADLKPRPTGVIPCYRCGDAATSETPYTPSAALFQDFMFVQWFQVFKKPNHPSFVSGNARLELAWMWNPLSLPSALRYPTKDGKLWRVWRLEGRKELARARQKYS